MSREPGPLERARALVETDLQFSAAIDLLESALADHSIDGGDLAQAQYLLAIAYVARGDSARASTAFEEMLALDPTLEPDALSSPKVHAAFRAALRAREQWQPAIAHLAASVEGERCAIAFELADPRAIVAAIELDNGTDRRTIPAKPGALTAELALAPLMPNEVRKIAVTLTAKNAFEHVVARAETSAVAHGPIAAKPVASADLQPSELVPPAAAPGPVPAAEPPWYASWWVWAGVIAVAAAAATTTVVLLRSGDDDVPTVHLP